MNAEQLLQHFERISEAPDAIKRLRRFILDLAVRGKLVEQDPSDEPASELVKRITAEKVMLVKAGEIKKQKPLGALPESPFPIPSNWCWSQLAEIGVLSPRNEAPDTLEVSFVPMPLIAADYGVANQHEIRPWAEIKKGYTHFAEGDVGLAKITPCFENGKSSVFRNLTGGLGSGTTELHIVRPLFVNQDYILLFLKSPHFIETGIPKMTGTAGQKRVPTNYFSNSPFPLPPLAEQHRIVAKVDELMNLCDQLDAAKTEREKCRDSLVAASLQGLNQPAEEEEIFREHARFTFANLPRITTRTAHIKQLRQTILNLAVRGKLVEQDPSDEPAAELLKRIAAENLEVEDLPQGWRKAKIGSVLNFQYGKGLKASERLDKGPVPVFGSNGIVGYTDDPLTVCPSIIIGRKGSAGALNICDGPSWTTDVAYFVEAPSFLTLRFLLNVLASIDLDKLGKGVKPGLSRSEAYEQIIPLPPLAEQQRIVAKVDELMTICDQLAAQITATEQDSRRFLESVLANALAPGIDLREVAEVA